MGLDPADETEAAIARGDPRARLADLRVRLAPPDRGREASPVLPTGVPDLDAHLPGGGLVLGPPHEIAPAEPADAIAALGFALALCARHLARESGEALIAAGPGQPLPYGHGLAGLGLDPARLLLLEAGSDAEVFRALEAALHARALTALIGLLRDGLPLKPGRRLQLAAEGPGAAAPADPASGAGRSAQRGRHALADRRRAGGPGPVRHPGQAALAGAARTLPQRAGRRLASGVGPCRASSASA
ncbi:ImuA protein [Methylobacterium oryzae CBMB20]